MSLFLVLGAAPAVADDIPDPPPEDVTAQLEITKTASATAVGPGDTLTYSIDVGCSAISDVGCRDAITTDVIPDPFVVQNVVPSGPNSSEDPVIDGQNIRVNWNEDIGGGATGMTDNTTSHIEVTVQVPDDVSYDYDGQTVTNNAIAEATNANDVSDSADVTINVPLNLDTSATKSFEPTQSLAAAGTPVTAHLGGTNESNATVDTLVIQDPVDPAATPNPFTYLGFTGFGDVSPPEGATTTTYEVYVDGAWVAAPDGELPVGVDPGDVQGTRVTFTGDIPAGATATVDLDLETTEEAASVPEDTVVTNDVQSQVALGPDTAEATAQADFTLQANTVAVAATKSFDPDVVVAGESSTATIGGSNESPFPIDSLTITEPSSGAFPDAYTFGGFTDGIPYPDGATSGTVIYQPSGEEVSFADGETPAEPADGWGTVTSFEVVFEGDIQPGAETSIPFDVDTDPDIADLPSTVTNEVLVDGANDGATGDATAEDDLYIYDEVIEPYIDKQIRPSQILASPGEVVTVTLQGGTTERPDPPDTETGTTGDADQIVIQDPLDPVEPNAWWNAFDLDSITQTPIPADSTLTVEYYNTETDTWETLDGPIEGPQIYSYDVPDDISEVAGGVRFVYDYTGDAGGFAPGTDLEPNFTSTLRPADDGRYSSPAYNTDPDAPHTTIPNCAQTSATSPTPGVPEGNAAMDPADCPEIELIPTDPGNADLIEKDFGTSSSGGNKSVIERSGDTIPSTLHWSTGGYSGFETVDITDVADPEGTAVEDSVYDAFNLIRVQPITDDNDPYIKYDQVTDVRLWDGTSWSSAANNPCPDSCDGAFPGMDLTAAEQESTLSVRLVFAESPTRAETVDGDLDAPPVGSGVARSFGDDRNVTLVWQIRDTKRSDGSPALAVDDYNRPDPGVVRNTADATGYPVDGDPISDRDADDVTITDVPITTTTDKTWQGGPLGIPDDGTPEDEYPLSRITVTTTNTTPMKVDQLQITDTAPGSTTEQDPFTYVKLSSIAAINVPDGTETTTVTLTCPDDSTETYSRDEALALTESTMPCDVARVQVLFDGRIVSSGKGVLELDVRLRPEQRGSGDPITPEDSPIADTAQGIVADVDAIQDCPPPPGARFACDQGTATIELREATFGIEASKSISPASQKEGDDAPVVVTIGAQNTGTARPYLDEITDDDASFFNAVDFVQMDPSWQLPSPVEHVQACYLTGGDFTAANVEADDVGGDWTCQDIPGGGPPFDDGDLTLDQAREFIDSAPAADIHGLRFRFMAGNESGWQNPAHPNIQVPFQVERRDDLRTGGPVPTNRSDAEPAPGETDAGVFNDTVDVDGESVLTGGDTRLTDDDSADATYTYEHLTVGVEVDKTPSGQVQPGEVIPFVLTYENTGEHALTNPVFTDVLPSDADGNQLIFDPDAAPGSSPYGFELSGDPPEPPNGDPLPTDESEITITEDGDTITFAMPDGTVLEPGQTYTITVELMLRPGLTPDDVVTNTDKISADEPFDPDNCAPNYDESTGECWDDTNVSPVEVAALSTVKKVKADVPVEESGIPEVWLDRDVLPEGSDVPDDYCDTAADADGFYRAPCVPVTYPGDTETWRFTITNAGTLPIDELISIDDLPHTGDTGVIVDLPRDSEWTPTFADSFEVADSTGTPIDDIDQQLFYSTTHDPCTAEIQNPPGTCPDGAWLPYDDTVDPSAVKAIKVVLDFPEDEPFQPGDAVSVQMKTTTTPANASDSSFPVAWNTVATGGHYDDGGTQGTIIPTEGRKVGVTYPTGPIQLQKTVSGDGAQYAPDEFTVQPTCTVDGKPVKGIDPVTLTAGGDPGEIDGLPWGAVCTATESDQGQSDQIIGTATVGGPDDEIGLVSIENVFDLGDLSVTKAVDSDAVDQDGNPIEYGPFEIAVSCEFRGDEVWADGYDADNPMSATIDDGETVMFDGLPTGAECTVSEPGDADAANTTITPDQPVTIGDQDLTEVQVENAYDVGSLHLRKFVPEAVREYPISQGPFTMNVSCTLTDASHPDGEVVYDADIVLPNDDNVDNDQMDYTIDNIATGAECTVTEPDDGAANAHVIRPKQVTIGDDTTSNVVVANFFGAGELTVTKSMEGPGADQYGAGPFEVSVECTYTDANGDQQPLDTPGGATRELSADNDYTATYDPLLVGSDCTIEETKTGGANSTVITDADGNEVNEFTVRPVPNQEDLTVDPIELTVTNTFETGAVKVAKTVVGPGAGPYAVTLACEYEVDGTAAAVDIPGGATRTLTASNGLSTRYDDLPADAECTLRESDTGGADSVSIQPNDGDPSVGVVSVNSNDTVVLEVINTFDTPPVTPPDHSKPSDTPSTAPLDGLLPGTGAGRLVGLLLLLGLALVAAGAALIRKQRGKDAG